MLYELYVEGKLGLHKGKPILMGVFTTAVKAEKEMLKELRNGHCAFVVKKKLPNTI